MRVFVDITRPWDEYRPMMDRLRNAVLLGAVGLGAGGCIPDLAEPDDFQEQVRGLRIDWDVSCPTACGDSPTPAMCNFPAPRASCTLYNHKRAADCLLTMEKLVEEGTCEASNQRMQNVQALCADVFSGCPEPSEDGGEDAGA